MASQMTLFYSSSNGDRWLLGREASSGRNFVRHEPNPSSGGRVSNVDVDEFLSRDGQGPQHQALRRLLGTTGNPAEAGNNRVRGASEPEPHGGQTITAAQIRAGRGLLDWSQSRLADAAHLNVSDLANCERGRETPPHEHLERIAQALGLAGVVLLREGQNSTGGPGVRMGALGTSTGQPIEKIDTDGNDNEESGAGGISATGR
jgi:transcriptional regulator with XRE-family HTH domain